MTTINSGRFSAAVGDVQAFLQNPTTTDAQSPEGIRNYLADVADQFGFGSRAQSEILRRAAENARGELEPTVRNAIVSALSSLDAVDGEQFVAWMDMPVQPIFTPEGKFSKENLFKLKIPDDPGAMATRKTDYYSWARDWGLADIEADDDPKNYRYAVARNIQDQAEMGYMIDIEASRNENLVYRKTRQVIALDHDQAANLADAVLGTVDLGAFKGAARHDGFGDGYVIQIAKNGYGEVGLHPDETPSVGDKINLLEPSYADYFAAHAVVTHVGKERWAEHQKNNRIRDVKVSVVGISPDRIGFIR